MIIAPSILAADFSCLKDEISRMSSADWLHFDVMDGHFVPNISFGPAILKSIKKHTDLYVDVHLMISKPLQYVDEFINAGADLIVFHIEAIENDQMVNQLIDHIKAQNVHVGISIKPQTPIEKVLPYINRLDVVLVMSVEPGFGGQQFMEGALTKISNLRQWIDSNQLKCLIEVDGGINHQTGQLCKQAGVDVVVAGSYLFNHEDPIQAIKDLR